MDLASTWMITTDPRELTVLDDRSPRWEQAACTAYGYPDMWHGDGETANQGDTAKAIAICQKCDIRTECYDYAYAHQLSGIWGASTSKHRKKHREQERRKANVR